MRTAFCFYRATIGNIPGRGAASVFAAFDIKRACKVGDLVLGWVCGMIATVAKVAETNAVDGPMTHRPWFCITHNFRCTSSTREISSSSTSGRRTQASSAALSGHRRSKTDIWWVFLRPQSNSQIIILPGRAGSRFELHMATHPGAAVSIGLSKLKDPDYFSSLGKEATPAIPVLEPMLHLQSQPMDLTQEQNPLPNGSPCPFPSTPPTPTRLAGTTTASSPFTIWRETTSRCGRPTLTSPSSTPWMDWEGPSRVMGHPSS